MSLFKDNKTEEFFKNPHIRALIDLRVEARTKHIEDVYDEARKWEAKADKWNKLIRYLKTTADDEDSDVWEFLLDECGVNSIGEEEEE